MLNIFIKTFIIIFFISSPIYSLEVKWVVDGLNEPESVVFDKKNSAIYISNINPGSIKTKMGKKVRNQKYSEFISPNAIADFIFDISKLKNPAFVEDIFLRRLVK